MPQLRKPPEAHDVTRPVTDRVSLAVAITISGKDKNGRAFVESAQTIEITGRGARVATAQDLLLGAEITVQNQLGQTAAAKVLWRGEARARSGSNEFGIMLLSPSAAESLWRVDSPPQGEPESAPPGKHPLLLDRVDEKQAVYGALAPTTRTDGANSPTQTELATAPGVTEGPSLSSRPPADRSSAYSPPPAPADEPAIPHEPAPSGVNFSPAPCGPGDLESPLPPSPLSATSTAPTAEECHENCEAQASFRALDVGVALKSIEFAAEAALARLRATQGTLESELVSRIEEYEQRLSQIESHALDELEQKSGALQTRTAEVLRNQAETAARAADGAVAGLTAVQRQTEARLEAKVAELEAQLNEQSRSLMGELDGFMEDLQQDARNRPEGGLTPARAAQGEEISQESLQRSAQELTRQRQDMMEAATEDLRALQTGTVDQTRRLLVEASQGVGESLARDSQLLLEKCERGVARVLEEQTLSLTRNAEALLNSFQATRESSEEALQSRMAEYEKCLAGQLHVAMEGLQRNEKAFLKVILYLIQQSRPGVLSETPSRTQAPSPRRILMYLGYLDAPGTTERGSSNPASRFHVIAGPLIDSDVRLANEWDLANSLPGLVPPEMWERFVFRACDLYHARPPFDKLGAEECHELLEKAMNLIKRHKFPILFGAVDELRLKRQVCASLDPADAAFRICHHSLDRWFRDLTIRESVILIADNSRADIRRQLAGACRSLGAMPGSDEVPPGAPSSRLIDEICFGDSRCSPGIQLAGICAYVIARHLSGKPDVQGFYNIIREQIQPSQVWPASGGELL
ncbi:MAG: DUF3800 domain-containing protein [Terriglobia bacterium]